MREIFSGICLAISSNRVTQLAEWSRTARRRAFTDSCERGHSLSVSSVAPFADQTQCNGNSLAVELIAGLSVGLLSTNRAINRYPLPPPAARVASRSARQSLPISLPITRRHYTAISNLIRSIATISLLH